MKGLTIFYLLILFLFLVGCGNEPKGNTSGDAAAAPATETKATDAHAGHDHSGHSHDGHDHAGHDHSGHSHDTKPAQQANKVVKEIKVDKKQQLADLEAEKGQATPEEFEAKKRAIQNSPSTITTKKNAHPSAPYANLPDACTLVNEGQIARAIGIDESAISLKDGSGPASSHSRACFFRWDHKGVANSGVMVQVQDNPLPDEFPDWAAYYINAKLTDGDKKPDVKEAFKYKKFEGLGVSGAYSFEMHRYMWRTEDGFVIGIAFNLPASEEQEVEWAKRIGAHVMKNFKNR